VKKQSKKVTYGVTPSNNMENYRDRGKVSGCLVRGGYGGQAGMTIKGRSPGNALWLSLFLSGDGGHTSLLMG
jgi:hypothetical protein